MEARFDDQLQPSKKQRGLAKKIEAVFERFYKEESAYTKAQLYKNEFFLRNDYALLVLKGDQDIFISFCDRTSPSYAALFTLLLDQIKGTNLFICEDYATDETGSMVCDEEDGSSTSAMVWNQKEAYYSMLRGKVEKVIIRKIKVEDGPQQKD